MDEEFTDLAHAVALGNLTESDTRRLQSLFETGGPGFRAEFDALVRSSRETLTALSAVTEVSPPAGLRARLLRQIAFEPQEGSTARFVGAGATAEPEGETVLPLDARRPVTRRWRIALAAAAAAVILVVGGAALGYSLRPAESPSLAESIVSAPDAQVTTGQLAIGGSATVLYAPSVDAALVLFENLAAPPADDVYQMWLIADGTPRSAGLVDFDSDSVTRGIIDEIGNAEMVAFTVEPLGGSSAPTSDPFAAISI